MVPYLNLGGDSSVEAYEHGDDWIAVRFRSGRHLTYWYTYDSTGVAEVNEMKRLAVRGEGLNSYIGRVIKTNYHRKE